MKRANGRPRKPTTRRPNPRISALVALASIAGAGTYAYALPPPEAPHVVPGNTPMPTPPPGPVLPYGTPVFLVLDDRVSSRSTSVGAKIRVHLQKPLVVNGVTVAPAGAATTLDVTAVSHAQMGDQDGSIAIRLDPLPLVTGGAVPLRSYHEYLMMDRSAGNLTTRELTDTIGDIFIPYHQIYHALRPGQQFVLQPGSVLRAELDAAIDATDPKHVVVASPAPLVTNYETPHADLTAPPFYTPAPQRPKPLPHGRATLPPSPTPSPSVSASPSPAAGTPSAAPPSAAPPLAGPSPSPSPAPSQRPG